jgi:hypothetical protein
MASSSRFHRGAHGESLTDLLSALGLDHAIAEPHRPASLTLHPALGLAIYPGRRTMTNPRISSSS